MWRTFFVVAAGYLTLAAIGILFLEGVLGGCDVGKCLFLPIR